VLWRIFGPKMDEVTGEWRKLQNEGLNDMYSSPNIVRVIRLGIMRWAGHVLHVGDSGGVYSVLVGKREGKTPLGRPRPKWEDNIKIDFQVVEFQGMEWIDLVQDRDRWQAVVNAVMNFRFP